MNVGDVINGWRIVEDVGTGRSGHVFIVCRECDSDRLFALKMQRTDRPDVAPDANAREAALLRAGMKKSPRVMPKLVEVGEWRGVPFFVMERIEEIDFPVPARRYRQFCVEAFTALAELHSWLVHCDIAPCHLGRKGGGIAFIDFDAALPHAEAARGGRCVGTDPYIAPEVASAGRLSEQSDMYSLAMVLLERQGKVKEPAQSSFTTEYEEQKEYVRVKDKVEEQEKSAPGFGKTVGNIFKSLFRFIRNTAFIVTKGEETVFTMPTWVFALLLFFFWEMLAPVMVVALFFGIRYSFDGGDGADTANSILGKAGDFAQDVRSEFVKKEDDPSDEK